MHIFMFRYIQYPGNISGLSLNTRYFSSRPYRSECPYIFMQLMNVVTAHLRIRAVSLSIPRRLVNKRSDSQSTYLSHKLHSSSGTKSGFLTKSKEVRFATNTKVHIYRYGISDSAGNSQSTRGPSKRSYSDYQNFSLSDSSFGINFPFSFGQTQCSSGFDYSRQIAFTTSANVPVISLETSHSSTRSSSYDQQYDQIPFEMVDEHQSLCSRSTHSPPRPPNIPLYGCQSLQLGSSSGTNESILSWSLVGDQSQLHINMLEIMAIRRLDKSLQNIFTILVS